MWRIEWKIVQRNVKRKKDFFFFHFADDASNGADKTANLRELYKLLIQRSMADGELDELLSLAEHLQPRAVVRSPSLRLRFGRSYSKFPVSF